MFCYQCEGTMRENGTQGCNTQVGACGKTEQTADLQDLLLFAMTGLSTYAVVAKQYDIDRSDIDSFMVEAVFSTLTNVNFDPERIQEYLRETVKLREQVKDRITSYAKANGLTIELPQISATQYIPAETTSGLLDQATEIGFDMRMLNHGEDVAGMYAFVLYGIKGTAAYADHARMLNNPSQAAYDILHESLAFLARESANIDEYVEYALKVGNANFAAMEALDHGHVGKYGHPEPTKVRTSSIAGKCILVSGHDLHDLEAILQQTSGKGINVYTHGELLPANAYPELKKYPHLVGNFGGAWHEQKVEFTRFPGAIVLTSNCLIEPQVAYKERIFSTNAVGWSGVKHIIGQDFSAVIDAALSAPGFTADAPEKFITIGFARNAVLSVADTVVNAVKSGAIKHFYLVGGCDVPTSHGDYYGDFARNTPKDSIVLTLGCAKYRFNQDDLGDIGGIPRVLDMGQCNDAYSAVQVALTLANAFECSVNELPLTLVVSWFEQKAVAIMLTLLALGLENVLWGPLLPAFATPKILDLLENKFKLTPITNVTDDMAKTLH